MDFMGFILEHSFSWKSGFVIANKRYCEHKKIKKKTCHVKRVD